MGAAGPGALEIDTSEETPACSPDVPWGCMTATPSLLRKTRLTPGNKHPGAFTALEGEPAQTGPGGRLRFQQGSEVGSAQPLLRVGRHGLVSSSPPCSRAGESWFLWQPMPASPPPPPCSRRREGGSRGMLGFCQADVRPRGSGNGAEAGGQT